MGILPHAVKYNYMSHKIMCAWYIAKHNKVI